VKTGAKLQKKQSIYRSCFVLCCGGVNKTHLALETNSTKL